MERGFASSCRSDLLKSTDPDREQSDFMIGLRSSENIKLTAYKNQCYEIIFQIFSCLVSLLGLENKIF